MNKRIISVLLIICLTFSTSATVFAQNTSSTYIQNEQGKSISYIGDYKLVLWDSGNIVYAEQYNSQDNLIASATANRSNGEIIALLRLYQPIFCRQLIHLTELVHFLSIIE